MREAEGVSELFLCFFAVVANLVPDITRSFLFTGPNGVQYRWAMGATGMNYPKVSTFCNLTNTLVAEPRREVGHHR